MIQADTIVYEKSGVDACLAVLDGGQLREFEVFNENGAAEGNVYLGRIVKKVSLADDKTGFMVNVGDDKEAFMNAQERGLLCSIILHHFEPIRRISYKESCPIAPERRRSLLLRLLILHRERLICARLHVAEYVRQWV